ncbi:hypothetical protein SAMN05216464_110110 [Mucilaginibacter pineti]|uniref:Uncharacterized protein n=1 Tax=Mucilaginibacter pineti TaxID=1391627 RepID=A0A1G7GEW2_9SPHI|nr:hypothetical protein [Mucilaginibacter pineti]SDE86613.1 hypothetical protein SAMN05216464_110110 [Mucilaginibacter pineti]
MKKTIILATLVIATCVCILFACKKNQPSPASNEAMASKNPSLRINAVTCNFVDLTGTLTTQTLSASNVYRLNGIVIVPSGQTLTIPAGTVIQGVQSSTNPAWLVIEKGGKLIATGTAGSPIVFTSNQPAGSRNPGDWGGIAFAGNAPTNVTSLSIPLKTPATSYNLVGGGSTPADNSGKLQYVQILFAGKANSTDPLAQSGLILNSVGTGTAIDHIQVSNSLNDGIATYGGTVKQTFMVSYNAGRTDFPISFGYEGIMQTLAAMRLNNSAVPPSNAYGFEISNNARTTSTATPLTQPIISNATVLGPNHCSGTTVSSNYIAAVHFRLNGAAKFYNSVFDAWNTSATQAGLLMDDAGSIAQTASNNLEFSYNSFSNSGATPYSIGSLSWTGSGGCSTSLPVWITGAGTSTCKEAGNQFSVTTLGYDGSFCNDFCSSGFTSNFVLGTTTLSAPNFTWDTGSAFNHVTYRGAFGSTDFTQSWTNWCAQNTAYCL